MNFIYNGFLNPQTVEYLTHMSVGMYGVFEVTRYPDSDVMDRVFNIGFKFVPKIPFGKEGFVFFPNKETMDLFKMTPELAKLIIDEQPFKTVGIAHLTNMPDLPPMPPTRTISEAHGETPESIQRREQWKKDMDAWKNQHSTNHIMMEKLEILKKRFSEMSIDEFESLFNQYGYTPERRPEFKKK